MKVRIEDDFDLYKIVESGQCFRPHEIAEGLYQFIYKAYILYIKAIDEDLYEISCSMDEWNDIWIPYFDLNINYAAIRDSIHDNDTYMRRSADCSAGIRILCQDKWEMLISYIISQRKSIPAIRSSIEKICMLCGNFVETEYGNVYLFPTAKQLNELSYDELATCGLGYRLDYIVEAAKFISENERYLEELQRFKDAELFDKLIAFKGVGKKVANCVMLFGYHRTGSAPVDVWIERVINEKYDGINPFDTYGEFAGIMQQYVFFYRRLIEGK